MAVAMRPRWSNWAGTYACEPVSIESPASEDEIVAVVNAARAAGQRVKVAGVGHSFTDIACTDGRMIRLDRYDRVLDVDTAAATATVQAGITIEKLGVELARHGLAQENAGDIAYQSIAGAISTATHGTGATLGNIATQIVGLSMVLADGSLLTCSADTDPDLLAACRVGLGALGVISTVTLRCLPLFNLHSVEQPRDLDEVLEQIDALVDGNRHFEFFWFPHTDRVQSITNNPTAEPIRTRGRASTYLNDILLENSAFGLVCRIGRARERWIPALNRFSVRLLSRSEVVDTSARVFANPRLVRFSEMEYAIPRAAAVETIGELRAMIARREHLVGFPVEVRFVAADDIMLSPAHGRDTCYIAVHIFQGMSYEPYFRDVEAITSAVGGRPHWGKLHFQSADTLRPRYPRFDDFLAVRNRVDPERRFGNAYLDQVLGRS
ncbi:MAG: FAD-binding protein [Chloroflexi bacterium]|nr:MAG: FAD-binding protein [Chloroflexota bacterium]